MTKDMVEKVARAIYEAKPVYEDRRKVEWPQLLDDEQQRFHKVARAAIEAMREPTEAMALEGAHAGHATIEDSWNAMIDAALTPSDSPGS